MASDAELVSLISNAEDRWGRPFVTAKEIANVVGMTRQGAHRRLDQLHEDGKVKKYKPGRGAIWWVDEDMRRDRD